MRSFTAAVLLAAMMTSGAEGADGFAVIERLIQAANAADESGEYVKAEALFKAVVTETEKLAGEDESLADALERLAAFYRNRNRRNEADPLVRRALAIRERVQGKDHHDVALTLIALEGSQSSAKERQGGEVAPMLRRALTILEATNGKDDPEVALVLRMFGLRQEIAGQFEEAEQSLTRALTILEQRFGPEGTGVAEVLNQLGDVHAKRVNKPAAELDSLAALLKGGGKKVESSAERHGRLAESFYKRAFAIREKTLEPGDPDIAISQANLGVLEMRLGREEEGKASLERWLASQEQTKAPASLTRGTVLHWLAAAAYKEENIVEAERRLVMLQENSEATSGQMNPVVSATLAWRAEIALKARRFTDAEQFLDEALEIEATLMGSGDPRVVEARRLMADRYADHIDDPQDYLRWHRLKMFGRHPDLTIDADTLGWIVRTYGKLLDRTNRAVPRPTEDNLECLKVAGFVSRLCDLDSLMDIVVLDETNSARTLDDVGLSHVVRLYDVERLFLKSPAISDAGLVHVKELPHLRWLYLSSPFITDAGMVHLTGLKDLEILYVGFNNVTDAGLESLSKLPKLRELDLVGIDVTDTGLQHLERVKSLRELHVRSTKVTQAGVDRLLRSRPELKYNKAPDFDPSRPPPAPVERPAAPLPLPAPQ